MSLTLDTNINSLNAQRNLTTSQASLSQALQRLSSGLRINSAADDAAGLAISSQFTTQINGTNQAVHNANDAISETQTAGGALSTLTDSLQSIRTLAVEAANGSNSAADRAALDQQVQQQIAEITRIASQTSFNGLNVLDGSSGTTTYQVGANVGNTISVNLSQGVRADQIGQYASSTNLVTGALATGDLSLQVGNGPVVSIAASVAGTGNAGQTAGSAYAVAQAINSAGVTGLTATASTATAAAAFATVTGTAAGDTYKLNINGVDIFGSTGKALGVGGTVTQSNVQTAINAVSSQTGVVASADSTGKLVLTASDGSNITATQVIGGAATGAGAGAGTLAATVGNLTVSAASAITVAGTTPGNAGLTAGTVAASTGLLSTQNVLTVTGANSTIHSIDSALATVSQFQSQLGAIQNRFTSTVGNLQATAQNLTSSRSTIQDADFAAETAKLTQSQVLQQAGISVLAQANAAPQLILKLLP
ncbi:MAG TPA: flagellin [Steroidobacteraceae bacterium]|jgi:flagellin|nr:flagellin [Steroidobacteraceae bacterium]